MRAWQSTLKMMGLTARFSIRYNASILIHVVLLAAVFVAATSVTDKTNGHALVIVILALSVLFVLLLFSERCVEVVRDARHFQLPNCRRRIFEMHVVMISGTVLIPFVALLLTGNAWITVALICFTGLLGLILPLVFLSRPWLIGINAPTLLFVVPMCLIEAWAAHHFVTSGEHVTWTLAPLIILLLGLWLWHWHGEFSAISPRRFFHRDIATGIDNNVTLPFSTVANNIDVRHLNRSPAAIVRMYLGGLYAPKSLQERASFCGLMILIVFALPCFVFILSGEYTIAAAEHTWKVLWPFSLYIAAWLSWGFHMQTIAKALLPKGIRIHDLALLPTMGNSRQQLWAFVRGTFSRPSQIVLALLTLALISRYCDTHDTWLTIRMLIAGMLFIVICTAQMLQVIVGTAYIKTAQSRTSQLFMGAWFGPVQSFWMTIVFSLPNVSIFSLLTQPPQWAPWIAIFLFVAISIWPAIGIYYLYKLARRPHPFVEVSE